LGWSRHEVLSAIREAKIRFLRLQFTDILGNLKSVAVPESRAEAVVDGEVAFDGSAVEGFVRVEESDMRLVPDTSTFTVMPWRSEDGIVTGYFHCDIFRPDGRPFEGCPRLALKRQVDAAARMGFSAMVGPEAEFYLFKKGEDGLTTTPTDEGAYFDFAASGKGEEARRAMVVALQDMGFQVEASHHENSPGQHEIGLVHADALTTADHIATLRLVVRGVASRYGLHATFMPKPVQGLCGSGLHLHMSLERQGTNAFLDEHRPMALSHEALCFIGGLVEHAQAYTAVVCSTVNSYKRLVPGYEAPVFVAWSERNRSPLVRVPAFRGPDTRVELRSPDLAGNPYLTLAVTLGAGLDGISRGLLPPRPVNRNLYRMDARERERLGISELPRDLGRALDLAEKSTLVRDVLGEHIMERFLEAKRIEWEIYSTCVHKWEVDHYLSKV